MCDDKAIFCIKSQLWVKIIEAWMEITELRRWPQMGRMMGKVSVVKHTARISF